MTNDPESVRAEALVEERTTGALSPDELVVVHSNTVAVDDPAFEAFVHDLAGEIAPLPDGYISNSRDAPGAEPRQDGARALEIVRERYARGEISREEYEQLRRDLASTR